MPDFLQGSVDARFRPVRDAFAALFDEPSERGGAVAVFQDGRPVVDLWAGHGDEARSRAWQRDTLVNVFSTTKGMTALCAHHLVDRGKLDLEATVARYWPEFAAHGKGDAPVRWLLDHSIGLPAIRRPLQLASLYDWSEMTSALADETPWWEPGSRHGYHPLTYGWLVGEVIRRVSGKSVGRYLRDEIAGPLGADVHVGLGAEHDARCADILPATSVPADMQAAIQKMIADGESPALKAFVNPFLPPNAVNSREWRAAEIPAANAHATARGLAHVYGAVARGGHDGVRVLSTESIERARAVARDGPDFTALGLHNRFGLGFMLGTPEEPFGAAERPFGHPGAGGSLAFADPETKLGFAYVMNRMKMGLYIVGPRAVELSRVVYECL